MNTADLNKPITSTKLNENMFKKFGVKVNLDKYTREELENYRNLLRTKVHNTESKASFNDLLSNESHQKDKHVIDILNLRIKEIVGEGKLPMKTVNGKKVPAFAADGKGKNDLTKKKTKEGTEDTTMNKKTEALKGKQTKLDKNHNGKLDADDFKKLRSGKKDESVAEETGKFDKTSTSWTDKSGKKHPAQRVTRKTDQLSGPSDDADEKKAKKKVKESSHKTNVKLVNEAIIRFIVEDEEGKAKSITAGTDMVNDFTSWMTRVGQYQTKSMIELADAIRANFGQQEAETFKSSVQPALDAALQALTQAREEISNSVAVLAGEAPAAEPMGGMDDMSGMDDMENPGDGDLEGGDEFGGSDAAAGGMETPGREMRESRKLFASKLAESHTLMRSLAR
jgi:hypothetical protein